ncbi:MAG: hypothetical protein ACRD9L_17620, partial [Bryobacteraceae bacterium]
LGSSFLMSSKDGHGKWFDQLTITTQGLGNDPYESAMARVNKNRLYRYEMTWRRNDYFNPGLVTGGGGGAHLLDTQYMLQDHDLTLFPDTNLQFFLGYSGSTQTGPAYSSIQLFDNRGEIFPLFSDLRRVWREYRVGNEFKLLGVRVNWMHGWQDYKEDTGTELPASVPRVPESTLTGTTLSALSALTSAQPYHGTSPYWRVALFTDNPIFNVHGRFTYTAGQRGFVLDESSLGSTLFGADNRQVLTFGNAQRPAATGNVNLSFTPTAKFSMVNSTSVYSIRTEGNSFFSQYDNATQSAEVLYFEYLGIRTISNDTDVNYQATPLLGVQGGYHYSNRLIRSTDEFTVGGEPSVTPAEQTNQLQAGDIGVRLRLWKPLSVVLAGEIGRNDNPLTPVAQRNYHALNGRVEYKSKALRLTAAAKTQYNVNAVTLSAYSSQARTYSFTGNWTPRGSLTLEAGYTRQHLYTIGGIAYFANQQLVTGEDSVYLSNLNSVTAGIRWALGQKADLYAGYTGVEDTGDGRATPVGNGIGSPSAQFQSVQTFPVAYRSPVARVSIRINSRMRWNAGYQYYGYRQNFYAAQGFRAHTGYTSISWAF